jgi:hypothetical protein
MTRDGSMADGIGEIVAEFAEKRKENIKYLKTLSFKCNKIPREEIIYLQKINTYLEKIYEWHDKEMANLGSNPQDFIAERQKIEYAAFKMAFDEINSLDFWAYKFSTMCGYGTGDELLRSSNDSIYFVSPSGVSLRFKRANGGRGIRKIIQALMEKIVFEKDGKINENPEKGHHVREYTSQEFLALVEWKREPLKDFHSPLRIYFHGENMIIPNLDNNIFHHEGDPVNWLESRK